MKTEKPTKLIQLLEQLLAETDKISIGKHYIAIVEESQNITFSGNTSNHFSDLVYKHLIRLSIKDYIHSGHSEESIRVLNDVIVIISDAHILIQKLA